MRNYKIGLFILLKIGLITLFATGGLLLVATLLNFLSYRSLLPPVIMIAPSPESFGKAHLQAVTQKNHNYYGQDDGCSHSQLASDISRYGGAEVRNIIVSAEWQIGNGDHQFEVTSIKFDYYFPQKQSWQSAEIQLVTATNLERENSLRASLPFRQIHCLGAGF